MFIASSSRTRRHGPGAIVLGLAFVLTASCQRDSATASPNQDTASSGNAASDTASARTDAGHAETPDVTDAGREPSTPAPSDAGSSDAGSSPPPAPIAGGYSPANPHDARVADAASHAITLLRSRAGDPGISLVTVREAAQQVVAGMNFRLVLDITTRNGARQVTVVLYENLQGRFQLTSVQGL